jgi:hypothetical protein
VSYNSANEITYSLYPSDGKGGYSETALEGYDGATLIAAETANTSGQHEQSFDITGIPNGTYKLAIFKTAHLKLEISNVVIEGGDVHLESDYQDSDVQKLTLKCGDINNNGAGDGRINQLDQAVILNFYNAAASANQIADLNGDGRINQLDQSIVLNNYNSSAEKSAIDLNEKQKQ